ncbi:cobalamin biosynthesis protein CbiX [Paenibacillus sp. J5C_2022]|uniref:sirohydrochlorin chelatase n=1 Tax=Paenibacillus sp. J5C2022 TaxID=2977129 RepID=UPI0021D0104E|nr:CbiX/SirB N-terminal domain-containing protein [Paenibacillus sp. J5C2022]MCU6711268.1 cobalamin biosynthesis protein CbiX [Paenibacillus sp. J5C2022]
MKPGVLVISHGSRETEWVRLVDAAVAASSRCTAQDGMEVPVVSAFLEIVENRLIQDGIDELESQGVTDLFVLPLFVSSGSTHVDEIAQAFGYPSIADGFCGDLGTFRISANVTYGCPMDDAPEVVELLMDNLSELSSEPEKEALLLIGHGSEEPVFQERWQSGLSRLAEQLRALGGFARADYALLLPDETSCKLTALQSAQPDEPIIVVPLFLSRGYFTNHVIPARLAGLVYRYNGSAMLPHPAIERWIERHIGSWLSGFISQRNEEGAM